MRLNFSDFIQSSELLFDVLGLELLDALDKVALLQAAVAVLAPVIQDLLQALDSHLLQIDGAPVQLLLVYQLADLGVFRLQLFTNFLSREAKTQRLGDLVDQFGGGVVGSPDVIAKSIFAVFGLFADVFDDGVEGIWGGSFGLAAGFDKVVDHLDADLAVAFFQFGLGGWCQEGEGGGRGEGYRFHRDELHFFNTSALDMVF